MIEIELKAVVDDLALRRAAVERAGGVLEMEGRLEDRRYDTAEGALTRRDHVLRLRSYVTNGERRAQLDWKGPTSRERGYKLREEIGTPIGDAEALGEIMERLGLQVSRTIDREIAQYSLGGATV